MKVKPTAVASQDATGTHVKLTKNAGATKNVIDVNVDAVVVSGSGP